MGVINAVKQVASQVATTATDAAVKSAKQIAKTPLDLLEDLLGQSPATKSPEGEKPTESNPGETQYDPAVLEKRAKEDEVYRAKRQQELHTEIQQASVGYNAERARIDAEKKAEQDQKVAERKFQVKNLEKQKQEDYALKMAKDASSAEKRVGAG
jgi:hypothetical protein